jgi:hypothetical protein
MSATATKWFDPPLNIPPEIGTVIAYDPAFRLVLVEMADGHRETHELWVFIPEIQNYIRQEAAA